MKILDLLRSHPGNSFIYELDTLEERIKKQILHSSYIPRAGGKIQQEFLNAFDSHNRPRYLLKVTVVETAPPPAKRGRRKGTKNKQEK